MAARVSMQAEVAPGTWKTIRLRGLVRGASLGVRVETSGHINILLVHESELARFPKPVRPAFAGALDRRLSFKVTLPVAGTYYVVLDNRKGTQARSVKLLIEALRPRSRSPKAPARPKTETQPEAI
ncbi:MAG TPA: hypothetical protein VHG88_00085 [Burkholderiales bacterium]|nr:hypothetical protein [Burkholderiales bacterium]